MVFDFNRWTTSADGKLCMEHMAQLLGVEDPELAEEVFTREFQAVGSPQRVQIDPVAYWRNEGRKSVYWLLRGMERRCTKLATRHERARQKRGKK